MAAACREHSARLARGSLPGARSTARPYRGPPGNARQDQARASLAVKERTSLMLDRLCSALLTIVDTLPGLHARALLLVDFAAARARPRAPNISNYARHSDGVEFFPALGQDRSGRARHKDRLAVGRTDLCPVKARRLARCCDDRGPALPAIWPRPSPRRAKGVKSKPAPARYRVGYADSIALTVQR